MKITTDDGLVGWSECTDSHGSPRGIEGVIKDLSELLIGKDPRETEKLYWTMYSRTRQSPGSIVAKAIGGIENALLDIKAKSLGVPVYELFGGAIREKIPLYWSHCGTTRVRAWQAVGKPRIATLEDVKTFGQEVLNSGFKVVKTNLAILGENPHIYMPAFAKSSGGPELNLTRDTLAAVENYIGTLHYVMGESVELAVDLNFNFKTEGFITMGRMLEKFNPMWLEMDSYNPEALLKVKQSLGVPICSGENLYGPRGFRPYFEKHAMDIASIDIPWNGFSQSKKIADLAELYEMNVTPHNYYSHLATFMSAQFCATVPNFKIMEVDVDDVPWREEIVTNLPKIENGILEIPKGPGWGTEVSEDVLLKHPWKI